MDFSVLVKIFFFFTSQNLHENQIADSGKNIYNKMCDFTHIIIRHNDIAIYDSEIITGG